jgi:hypothetical protein
MPGTYDVTLHALCGGVPSELTKSIVVDACGNGPVRLSDTDYSLIHDAYQSAGSGGVLQLQALPFEESLDLQEETAVTLKGGFGCDYVSNPSFSVLRGTLTISHGTAILENLIIGP